MNTSNGVVGNWQPNEQYLTFLSELLQAAASGDSKRQAEITQVIYESQNHIIF